MDMSALLTKMFILAALMSIGWFLFRRGSINKDFVRMGSDLALNLFSSATIISSAIHSPADLTGRALFVAIGVCAVTTLLCYAVGNACTRSLSKRDSSVISELLISAPNMMFIGVPVAQVLYGPQAVLYIALSCLTFNVAIYTYGMLRVKGLAFKDIRPRELVNVPLVATAVSVLLLLVRFDMPAMITELSDAIADATLSFSMLVIGATLGSVNISGLFTDLRIYAVSFVRLLIVPILTYFVLSLFVKDSVLVGSMVICAACPSGIIVSILAAKYDRQAAYASKGVLMTTALSMLTIPFIVYILPI